MANEVKLNHSITDGYCDLGDVFLINGDPYMLVSVSFFKVSLASLKDGCRWDDPYEIRLTNKAECSVERIIERIIEDHIGEEMPTVEYIGKVKIEVSKL